MRHHQFSVAIIGAGLGGIGMAMKLRASGEGSLVVLEREAALGGVWRANTYPGCVYDAPSHLYWYAFDQVPDWSRVYARQPEILRTLQETAARHDVVRFIRYNSMVTGLIWDDSRGIWHIHVQNAPAITARVVVTATGQLSQPSFAGIPGRETFKGSGTRFEFAPARPSSSSAQAPSA